MNTEEKRWLFTVLCALPAMFGGYYCGLNSSSSADSAAQFPQFLWCAFPIALLALTMPRYWHIPAIIFAITFHLGFQVPEAIGDACQNAVGALIGMVIVPLGGQLPSFPPRKPPTNPMWFYVVSFVVAFVIAAIRTKAKTNYIATVEE